MPQRRDFALTPIAGKPDADGEAASVDQQQQLRFFRGALGPSSYPRLLNVEGTPS